MFFFWRILCYRSTYYTTRMWRDIQNWLVYCAVANASSSLYDKNKKLSCRRDSARRLTQTIYCQTLDSMGYIFVAGSIDLASVNLTQFGPKSCHFVWNNAIIRSSGRSRSLKVTDFGADREATASDRGCLYLTPSFGVNPWILDCEIWPQKLETSTYHVEYNTLRYIEPFRRGSPVWQTDRQTDGRTNYR